MHVEALVLHILRETFKIIGPVDYPFRVTDDYATTKMLIDTEFNKVSEVIGQKPLVIVGAGPMSMGAQVLQDLATYDMVDGGRGEKVNIARSSIQVGVYGRTRTEALALGNEVFNLLALSRTHLVRLTGIQNITDVSLSKPAPYKQDTTVYVCEAGFSYFLQYKWVDVFTPDVLNQIGLFINDDLTLNLSSEV